VRPKLEKKMNKESTYYVQMNAYLAVVFVENIQTDELCHYVGEGSDPSGNVQLLGKKHFSRHGTSHGRGWHKERKHYSRERSTAIDADD
jgi:hypothetical protein